MANPAVNENRELRMRELEDELARLKAERIIELERELAILKGDAQGSQEPPIR